MIYACLLSFFTGFISLGQEILWTRLFSFTNLALPQSFAFVLSFFLIGIALGAYVGKKICESFGDLWFASACTLFLSSLFSLISPWIYADYALTHWQHVIGAISITFTAFFPAIIFPIAHHLGAPATGTHVGRSVSRVYVANIIGSTLGPLLVGAVFLYFLTTQQCFFLMAALTALAASACASQRTTQTHLAQLSALIVALLIATLQIEPTLLIKKVAEPIVNLSKVIETRQGIITAYKRERGGDLIFGSNVYDGTTNLDPIENTNAINRALILGTLHKNPERVLIIGLSSGTWLKVIETFPQVKQIDVVEINPGYLELIKGYPRQAAALKDPRVNLYIDDGRRWLKSHRDKKYDLFIMNTTYYWRSYSTNLLSREFLTIVRQHLAPNALIAYNSTYSPDALYTASKLFKYTYLYMNFIIAADFDWRPLLTQKQSINYLMQLKMDGKPLFPAGSQPIASAFLHYPLNTLEVVQKEYHDLGRAPLEMVTDNNLITEYRFGHSL